ncbi:RNA methyltransferase [Ferruginibacter sp. HRS2-29]|uniref:TrmH family RNA methyltransferase n=1 Tax=Ferruginibacter sp. HRS2-29 TaxID=2487334 RepID=UPI0020CFA7D6|nr:RNA methyltransferase [Ferruginibacter sp. HRS2-29]MCP9752487.1 RNA methyltransferase [Ferruginibacter sp. HRS2-29]
MFSKSTVKYIQSLQHKKFRDEYGAFIAEGPKVVGELLETNIFNCTNVYALEEWIAAAPASLKATLGGTLVAVKDFELEKISALAKPNLVLAVFEKKPARQLAFKDRLTLVLDDIQDPGNLGTIIRIADWFGIQDILCSLHTADMYNPKVVQSTMASLARVNVVYADITQQLLSAHVKKYAAALDGTPLEKVDKLKEGIIIIGNESKGISPAIMQMADEKITIARVGLAESLNAGVATGIILHQLRITN